MWTNVKTEGIIIADKPWREADRLYSILTKDFGKLEVLGRGAAKIKAKLSPHLEPFSLLKLELIKGRAGWSIIGVEKLAAYPDLRQELSKRILALTLAGVIDQVTRTESGEPELYEIWREWLGFLNRTSVGGPTRQTFILGGFLMKLLTTLGYSIELTRCLSCQASLHPLAIRWHEGRGGLICTSCLLTNANAVQGSKPLEAEIYSLLLLSQKSTYTDWLKPSLEAKHVTDFTLCVHDLWRYHVPGYLNQEYWQGILGTVDLSPSGAVM